MTACIELVSPHTPVVGIYAMPGSKSYTNRALVLSALAEGESVINNASPSADSDLFLTALNQLGYTTHTTPQSNGTSSITVHGQGRNRPSFSGKLDVGPAGTTMRFLTALLAATPSGTIGQSDRIELCGSPRMHARPIAPLVDALVSMGAQITYTGTPGCPPLILHGATTLCGGNLIVDGSVSSQFISALLMVAPLCLEPVRVILTGPRRSRSYIDMTLHTMSEFGVGVLRPSEDSYVVPLPALYSPRSYSVEGDLSGASYLWALAALSGGEVTVTNVDMSSAQGDKAFPLLLEKMGCTVHYAPNSITVRGSKDLRAIKADMSDLPDTAQTLAVVAACAEGTTVISGLSTLRIKETDRLAALQAELAKLSIASEIGEDWIKVHGGTPSAGTIATYDDHRMAMSFAPLATRLDGLRICEPSVVEKSFPSFWDVLRTLGISSHANS